MLYSNEISDLDKSIFNKQNLLGNKFIYDTIKFKCNNVSLKRKWNAKYIFDWNETIPKLIIHNHKFAFINVGRRDINHYPTKISLIDKSWNIINRIKYDMYVLEILRTLIPEIDEYGIRIALCDYMNTNNTHNKSYLYYKDLYVGDPIIYYYSHAHRKVMIYEYGVGMDRDKEFIDFIK